MRVLAIDPGNELSAWCVYSDGRVLSFGIDANALLLFKLEHGDFEAGHMECAELAIEMIASYGMPVGREVFETCLWIGRFIQSWSVAHTLVYRRDVKLHLCGSARAKDGNVRQALIDRYGGKEKAIGRKGTPGPLFGVRADVWSALAVAVTFADGAATRQLSPSNRGAS